MEFNFLPTIVGALPVVFVFIVIVVMVGVFSKKVTDEFKREGKNKNVEQKPEENKMEEKQQNPNKTEDAKKLAVGGKVLFTIGIVGMATIVIVSLLEIFSSAEPVIPSLLTFMPICIMLIVVGSILGFSTNLVEMMKPQNTQNKKEIEIPKQENKKTIYRCDYCGARLEETDKRCPGCGARRKVKKD